jgi:hypothetical protein
VVHVLDLIAATEGHAGPAVRRAEAKQHEVELESGKTPKALDERALRQYRQRLRELGEEIAAAEAHNDVGRVAQLRREAEVIGDELSRSTGRGGRARQLPGALERARLNVTRAIRTVQRQLGQHCPEMERHLARTVRTGQVCCYDPGPDSPLVWETSANPTRPVPLRILPFLLTFALPGNAPLLRRVAEVMETWI